MEGFEGFVIPVKEEEQNKEINKLNCFNGFMSYHMDEMIKQIEKQNKLLLDIFDIPLFNISKFKEFKDAYLKEYEGKKQIILDNEPILMKDLGILQFKIEYNNKLLRDIHCYLNNIFSDYNISKFEDDKLPF